MNATIHVFHSYKKEKMGLKGWLRLGALSTLPEDLSSILSTHMAVCNTMCQGIQHLLLVSKDTRHAHGTQIFMQAEHPYTQET